MKNNRHNRKMLKISVKNVLRRLPDLLKFALKTHHTKSTVHLDVKFVPTHAIAMVEINMVPVKPIIRPDLGLVDLMGEPNNQSIPREVKGLGNDPNPYATLQKALYKANLELIQEAMNKQANEIDIACTPHEHLKAIEKSNRGLFVKFRSWLILKGDITKGGHLAMLSSEHLTARIKYWNTFAKPENKI